MYEKAGFQLSILRVDQQTANSKQQTVMKKQQTVIKKYRLFGWEL